MLTFLAKVATNPIVVKILVPSLTNALSRVFHRWADRLEHNQAIKAARAAKTAEELRDASKKLSDATLLKF